jgi:hypothetical protein
MHSKNWGKNEENEKNVKLYKVRIEQNVNTKHLEKKNSLYLH